MKKTIIRTLIGIGIAASIYIIGGILWENHRPKTIVPTSVTVERFPIRTWYVTSMQRAISVMERQYSKDEPFIVKKHYPLSIEDTVWNFRIIYDSREDKNLNNGFWRIYTEDGHYYYVREAYMIYRWLP